MIFGDFTLRGVTKQISFPFQIAGFAKDARGTVKIGIIADTEINRRDYGVNYTGNLPDGTLGVADMIKVSLQIEAILQTPPVAK